MGYTLSYLRWWTRSVSIQLISLTSRETSGLLANPMKQMESSFHSINFPNE